MFEMTALRKRRFCHQIKQEDSTPKNIDIKGDFYMHSSNVCKTHMLEDLRCFYPDINWESPVTVIRWK